MSAATAHGARSIQGEIADQAVRRIQQHRIRSTQTLSVQASLAHTVQLQQLLASKQQMDRP
jgi:hypothetical protein